MEAKVLLFHLQNATGKKIKKLCTRLKIEAISVEEKDFMKPLKEIAGIEGINEKVKAGNESVYPDRAEQEKAELERVEEVVERKEEFSESMLVMVNFTDELLDRYLKEYKVMHIDRIDLKAVLTEYNQNWDVLKLYQELCGEREYFRKNSTK